MLCKKRQQFFLKDRPDQPVDGVGLVTVVVPHARDGELLGVPYLPLRSSKKDGGRVFRPTCFTCFKAEAQIRQNPAPQCTHRTNEERQWTTEYPLCEVAYGEPLSLSFFFQHGLIDFCLQPVLLCVMIWSPSTKSSYILPKRQFSKSILIFWLEKKFWQKTFRPAAFVPMAAAMKKPWTFTAKKSMTSSRHWRSSRRF